MCSVDVEGAEVVGGVEAGAVDDRVDRVFSTFGCPQPAFGELDDR